MDVDSASTNGLNAPAPPSSGQSGDGGPGPGWRAGLIAGVIILFGLVAAVLALQPNDGETAAGTQRAPTTTTTTTVAPTTTTTDAAATDDSAAELPEGVEIIPLDLPVDPFFASIVETDFGFWMVSFAGEEDVSPIYRSIGGVSWTEVETNLAVRVGSTNEMQQLFGQLVETDTGFAVLRESFDLRVDGPPRFERLVSTDGVDWTIQQAFEASDLFGSQLWFAVHAPNALAYSFGDSQTVSPQQELLESTLRPEIELPESGVCWFDLLSSGLTAWSCDAVSEAVELTAEDFLEADRIVEIRQCVRDLSTAGPSVPDGRRIHLFDEGITHEFTSSALTFGAAVLDDGTFVAIDTGQSEGAGPCVEFLEPGGRPAAIEVWHPDGTQTTAPLPEAMGVAEDVFSNGLPPFLVSDGGTGVYVTSEGDVWHFDTESLLWTERLSLIDEPLFGIVRPQFSGQRVAITDGASLVVGDLQTGEIIDIPLESADSAFFDSVVVYLDDTQAFIAVDSELFQVTLPPPEA